MDARLDSDPAFPTLSPSQLARLSAWAEPVSVAVGDVLFAAGDHPDDHNIKD
jgi:hypothetical protein